MTYFITRSNAESLGWPKLMQLKNRETVWTKIKDKWTGKIEIRRKKFLAVGEACMAIFWPTPGSKGSLASNVHVVRKRLHFNNAHQESTHTCGQRKLHFNNLHQPCEIFRLYYTYAWPGIKNKLSYTQASTKPAYGQKKLHATMVNAQSVCMTVQQQMFICCMQTTPPNNEGKKQRESRK